jgi:hypothetical protein
LLLGFVSSVGCMHFQPIGPLAEMQGLPANPALGEKPTVPTPEPIIREAPKPTPPAVYISPSDVTPSNAAESMKKLQQELDTDRRGIDAMPRYAEVSNVR